MTTNKLTDGQFTKEQLIARIKRQRDAYTNKREALTTCELTEPVQAAISAASCDLAILEIALAALTAEPVAYMVGGHYLMHAQDPKVDNYNSAVPLYTAPQPLTDAESAELQEYRKAGKGSIQI